MAYPLAFGAPGPWEWIIIGLFGLLIFGKRLPEVGRSLGRGIVEFKKGLRGVEDEIQGDEAGTMLRSLPAPSPQQPKIQPAAQSQPQYKFDPYTGKPLTPMFDPYTGQRIAPPQGDADNQQQPEHSQT